MACRSFPATTAHERLLTPRANGAQGQRSGTLNTRSQSAHERRGLAPGDWPSGFNCCPALARLCVGGGGGRPVVGRTWVLVPASSGTACTFDAAASVVACGFAAAWTTGSAIACAEVEAGLRPPRPRRRGSAPLSAGAVSASASCAGALAESDASVASSVIEDAAMSEGVASGRRLRRVRSPGSPRPAFSGPDSVTRAAGSCWK